MPLKKQDSFQAGPSVGTAIPVVPSSGLGCRNIIPENGTDQKIDIFLSVKKHYNRFRLWINIQKHPNHGNSLNIILCTIDLLVNY